MPKPDKDKFVFETSIPGLFKIERPIFKDDRGFFHEVFRMNELLRQAKVNFSPVQLGHSRSLPRVIRAIHTEGWQKLVYPITGRVFAAIVDVRPASPAFGQVEEFVFDNTREDSPHTALFLPPGIGNSVCVVGDEPADYLYLVDEYWDNAKAQGIAWDDPDIGIKWPIKDPILSSRDRQNPRLRELFPEKFKNK